jgi:hypothetical protein
MIDVFFVLERGTDVEMMRYTAEGLSELFRVVIVKTADDGRWILLCKVLPAWAKALTAMASCPPIQTVYVHHPTPVESITV